MKYKRLFAAVWFVVTKPGRFGLFWNAALAKLVAVPPVAFGIGAVGV